jgi:hypothetical protein
MFILTACEKNGSLRAETDEKATFCFKGVSAAYLAPETDWNGSCSKHPVFVPYWRIKQGWFSSIRYHGPLSCSSRKTVPKGSILGFMNVLEMIDILRLPFKVAKY